MVSTFRYQIKTKYTAYDPRARQLCVGWKNPELLCFDICIVMHAIQEWQSNGRCENAAKNRIYPTHFQPNRNARGELQSLKDRQSMNLTLGMGVPRNGERSHHGASGDVEHAAISLHVMINGTTE